jgi:polysaccharide export outer membrane protein
LIRWYRAHTCACLVIAWGCASAPPVYTPPGVTEPIPSESRAPQPDLPVEPPNQRTAENQRIGPNDLLEIIVLEDAELNRSARVRATGEISLPLLEDVPAAGRTPRELELELEGLLRARYVLDPHVSVQIVETESQAVSVVGAVNRPGVFQIRGARSLLEVLALAGGLSAEAGDGVLVVRSSARAGAAEDLAAADAVEVDLEALLESGELRHNIAVYPGDVVKVKPAGLIYVVGEVNRPGAFPLERGGGLTVVQAIALGQGLRSMAARGRTMIIRTTAAGERMEIPVDLGDVLAGRALDPRLEEKDIVFVPNSTTRAVALGVVDALVRMVTLRGVF